MSPTPTHGRCSGERGAAAVELALVLPILFTLLIGIVEFGQYYSAKIAVTTAAREGARAVALGEDGNAAVAAAVDGLDGGVTASVPNSCTEGSPVTVSASYSFRFDIPALPSRTVNITSRGVMRCGG